MNGKKFAIDTNIFIYFLDENSQFYPQAYKTIAQIIAQNSFIITSILTLTKLLSLKAPKYDLDKLEREFMNLPQLQMIEVNFKIAKNAAKIRREYGFRIADAIQLATASEEKALVFITNDERLKSFKKLKVVNLNQI